MSNTSITLHVTGRPRAQPRGRHSGGRVISTTGKAKNWKQLIEVEARNSRLEFEARFEAMGSWCADDWLSGALRVDIDWYFDTPQADRWGKPHTHKPDRDNLDKLVLDAMVKGGLIGDDKLVAQGRIAKWWAPKGGVVVVICPAQVKALEEAENEVYADSGEGGNGYEG